MIRPAKNSLVLVRKDDPAKPDEFFFALVDEVMSPREKGYWVINQEGDRRLALPEQVIPIINTDGSFKNPRKAVEKLYPEIISMLVRTFYVQKATDTLFRLIKEGSLVIVLPGGKITEAQWGIVLGKKINSCEVSIGRSFVRRPRKILITPEQLIPVINTNLETKNPLKALRKKWGEILMYLILRFYTQRGSQATRKLLAALSSIDKNMIP